MPGLQRPAYGDSDSPAVRRHCGREHALRRRAAGCLRAVHETTDYGTRASTPTSDPTWLSRKFAAETAHVAVVPETAAGCLPPRRCWEMVDTRCRCLPPRRRWALPRSAGLRRARWRLPCASGTSRPPPRRAPTNVGAGPLPLGWDSTDSAGAGVTVLGTPRTPQLSCPPPGDAWQGREAGSPGCVDVTV